MEWKTGCTAAWWHLKVRISGYGNLRTMSTDEWATSKSIQLSTKVDVTFS